VLLIAPLKGYETVFAGTAEFTQWTQTLAGLEVLHSLIGRSLQGNCSHKAHYNHVGG
jgi:hypothetical protein